MSYRADRVEIVVQAPGPRLLVLTDVYYPGWKATVGGREAPIYPANLAFRGVVVEPGSHAVVFTYEPTSFALGAMLAGLSTFVLAGLLGWLAFNRQWVVGRR